MSSFAQSPARRCSCAFEAYASSDRSNKDRLRGLSTWVQFNYRGIPPVRAIGQRFDCLSNLKARAIVVILIEKEAIDIFLL